MLGFDPDKEFDKLKNGGGLFSECYSDFGDAEIAMTTKECGGRNCDGGLEESAMIVAVLFNVPPQNEFAIRPIGKPAKIDMRFFDPKFRKLGAQGNNPVLFPDFDFGLYDPHNSVYLHANHKMPSMVVTWSTEAQFMAPYNKNGTNTFDKRAFCVVCPDWSLSDEEK